MTNEEFKAQQAKLGLTNTDMALVFGVSVRTIEKWRQGKRSVPGPAIQLIRICHKYKGAVAFLLNAVKSRNNSPPSAQGPP